MPELFVDSLIIMLVVVDPVGIAPIFAALTHGEAPDVRRRTAIRGTLIAGAILVVFVLAGDTLLNALGIFFLLVVSSLGAAGAHYYYIIDQAGRE